ncbi:MAG: hypothetical protein JWQ13_1011 [Ramlibacter sp.]|nr:hypothetical protein [Ramlibacter sp.]
MRSAPDVLWVFLALPLVMALGLSVALLAAPGQPLLRHERARLLALACAAGLLVNYAIGMLVAGLRWVLLADVAIAGAALSWAVCLHRGVLAEMFAMGWLRWLSVCALLLLAAGAVLFEPLHAWDARTIWFFAAKRIFFGGGVDGAADWTLPAYGFSHADYPKLLPLVAAQFAEAWGVWNEYIPKAGLLVLLAPAALGLAGLAPRFGLSLAVLAAPLLLSTRDYLWNGYLDTYLAIYGVLAMLYFARWLSSSAPLDLALGGTFVGIAVNLKNEGALLTVCIGACLVAWLVLARGGPAMLRWRTWPAGAWLALLLPWIGFAAWALTRHQWQLANDLQLGTGSSLQRVWQRLDEGQLAVIAKAILVKSDIANALGLLLVSGALARVLRVRIPASAWFPAAVALLYSAGLVFVYLATPNDLAWHLASSVDRTMLLATVGFLGSTYLVLEAMEGRDPVHSASPKTTGLQT